MSVLRLSMILYVQLMVIILLPSLVIGFMGAEELLQHQVSQTKQMGGAWRRFSAPRLDRQRLHRRKGSDYRVRGDDAETSPTALKAAVKKFKNFEQVLDTFHEEPVMIYFSTRLCGPCQLMQKEVEAVRKSSDVKMFSIDTEKWPQVGSRFSVATLPCLLVFRQGEVLLRMEGVNKAEHVLEQVQSFL